LPGRNFRFASLSVRFIISFGTVTSWDEREVEEKNKDLMGLEITL